MCSASPPLIIHFMHSLMATTRSDLQADLRVAHLQAAKQLVLNYYQAIQDTLYQPHELHKTLQQFTATNWRWRGVHPFNELHEATSVVEQFWQPLMRSFTSLQRRQDIFFAGFNDCDQPQTASRANSEDLGTWVVSMGHWVGLFDQPFLNIPPTQKMGFLRYAEFNQVADHQIVNSAVFIDIPHLMTQAGMQPFPQQRGATIVQPGPMSHEGLCFAETDANMGQQTLALINAMGKLLGQWQGDLSLNDELRQTWHDDMIWWGPTGIGATYTIDRYILQHSGHFRHCFENRSKTTHCARLAEGHFGGFFGWPNFTANLREDYLGMPASAQTGEFRVVDIYRREDDKLRENWVFIDLLHWMKSIGFDFLKAHGLSES